jgi:hypothetical protein
MSAEEAQALGRAEFWDERYAKADGDKPTHEWFRAFDALEPFFTKHLFVERKAETEPRILHLGSGDSVSCNLHILYCLYMRSDVSRVLFISTPLGARKTAHNALIHQDCHFRGQCHFLFCSVINRAHRNNLLCYLDD